MAALAGDLSKAIMGHSEADKAFRYFVDSGRDNFIEDFHDSQALVGCGGGQVDVLLCSDE